METSDAPAVKRPTPLASPLLGILLGVAGTAVMAFAFVNGIPAALDGSGNGATLYVVLFLVGAALALVAIILGLVGLVRGGHRVLSALSVLIGLLPVVLMIVIWVVNVASVCCARPV